MNDWSLKKDEELARTLQEKEDQKVQAVAVAIIKDDEVYARELQKQFDKELLGASKQTSTQASSSSSSAIASTSKVKAKDKASKGKTAKSAGAKEKEQAKKSERYIQGLLKKEREEELKKDAVTSKSDAILANRKQAEELERIKKTLLGAPKNHIEKELDRQAKHLPKDKVESLKRELIATSKSGQKPKKQDQAKFSTGSSTSKVKAVQIIKQEPKPNDFVAFDTKGIDELLNEAHALNKKLKEKFVLERFKKDFKAGVIKKDQAYRMVEGSKMLKKTIRLAQDAKSKFIKSLPRRIDMTTLAGTLIDEWRKAIKMEKGNPVLDKLILLQEKWSTAPSVSK